MNSRGQMGIGFLVGILVVVMAILLFTNLVPSISESIVTMRSSDGLNCASAPSYNASLETDTLSCTVGGLIIPFIIMGVLIASVMYIVDRRSEQAPVQRY